MTMWLSRASWWTQALAMGAAFAAAHVVIGLLDEGEPHYARALSGGLVFGALMGPQIARQQRRLRAAAEPIPLGREKEAIRAASRGPVPVELAVRSAAVRVTRHRQQELARANGRARIAVPVIVLGIIVLATSVGWWLLVPAAFVAGVGVHQVLLLPRRIDRRLALLCALPSPDPTSAA